MKDTLISLEEEFARIAGTADVLGDAIGEPAYLYCRSSDKMQAKEGRESLSRQLLAMHEKAAADGRSIPLDMTYWDIWRGKDAERPAFHQLLSDVKDEKRSDIVYIDQTDRLSRNKAVYYVLMYDLTRYGLTAHFHSEEDDLIRHIKIAFDEIELERRRYRQVQANRARATKGHVISRFAAFGYDLSEDKLSYIINEEQAEWVRRIYDWYTSGKSLVWIAKTMTEIGPRSPKGKKLWYPESIRVILRNEVYKGTYVSNRYDYSWVWDKGEQKRLTKFKPEDEWIYVSVPAIISEEQWNLVQSVQKRNVRTSARNSRKHEWLLSGILRCVCGYAYTAKHKKNKRTLASGEEKVYTYEFYRCGHNARTWRPDSCDRGLIRKDRLESYVIEALESLFVQPEIWDDVLEDRDNETIRWQEQVQSFQQEIAEIDAQLEELLQITLEQRSTGARRLFAEKQRELENRRQIQEEQMAVAESRLHSAQQSVNKRKLIEELISQLHILGGLSSLPYESQREILVQLLDEVVLDTKEQWFELRGVLRGTFKYDSKGDDDSWHIATKSAVACGMAQTAKA